jgi:hypothetical protein
VGPEFCRSKNPHICRTVCSWSTVRKCLDRIAWAGNTVNVAGRSPWPITVEGFRSLHVTQWWTGKGQAKCGKSRWIYELRVMKLNVAARTWFLRLGAPAPPCNLPSRIFKRIIQLTLFFPKRVPPQDFTSKRRLAHNEQQARPWTMNKEISMQPNSSMATSHLHRSAQYKTTVGMCNPVTYSKHPNSTFVTLHTIFRRHVYLLHIPLTGAIVTETTHWKILKLCSLWAQFVNYAYDNREKWSFIEKPVVSVA